MTVYASPISIRANPEQIINLGDVVNKIYAGTTHGGFTFDMFDNSDGPPHSTGTGYWNIGTPTKAELYVAGTVVPFGANHHASIFVQPGQVTSAQLVVGNQIGAALNVITQIKDASGASIISNIRIDVIPAGVYVDPTPNVIDGSDIAAATLAYGAAFSGSPSPFGCQIIARDIAAAAGAPLPYESESLTPSLNGDQGFWHVVHRGDQTLVQNWESLLKPGDIVRFDYIEPAAPQHTFTVISTNGSLVETFDNFNGVDVQHHSFNYESVADPSTVTIYRLDGNIGTAPAVRAIYQSVFQSRPSDSEIVDATWKIDAGIITLNDYRRQLTGDQDFISGPGNDTIDGGNGFDVVHYDGPRSDYTISVSGSNVAVKDKVVGRDGNDQLTNVERLAFSDGTIAFDLAGNAGQAYRVYQAAFNRTPDTSGLGYWIKELDAGKGDLAWVANNFILSTEFKATYGTPSTVTDTQFIGLLYNNVLHRNPDATGLAYWQDQITHGFARERILVFRV